MNGLTEIRWHARAGQGAKTAAQILALALLREGNGVQAFPEYGPERRGAPLRAFTRVSDRPIRRHDTITDPDLVVVLEPSLVHEAGVADGLEPDGFVLLNGDEAPPELDGVDVRCVPATKLAETLGSSFVNVDHARRSRGRPRRARARAVAGSRGGDARHQGRPRRRVLRPRGGIRMAELSDWHELPVAGAVRPGETPRPATGGWRTGEKPSVELAKCVNCLLCWLYCPDSAILLDGETFTGFDLDYCKGCAICAEVCPVEAIAMVPE